MRLVVATRLQTFVTHDLFVAIYGGEMGFDNPEAITLF